MKLDKKQTITLIAVASSTMAIAFFLYKVRKEIKRQTAEGVIDIQITEARQEVDTVIEMLQKEKARKIATTETIQEMYDRDEQRMVDAEVFEEADPQDALDAYDDLLALEERFGIEESADDIIYAEEVETLKYPVNSNEALIQYRDMRLAEFDSQSNERKVLNRLFQHRFTPTTEQDENLLRCIKEERAEFFGDESIHVKMVSMAELILYLANTLDFDLDGGIVHWTRIIIYNLNLMPGTGEVTLDNILDNLVRHVYQTHLGFGMFALNDDEYQELDHTYRTASSFLAQYHIYVERIMVHGEGEDAEQF